VTSHLRDAGGLDTLRDFFIAAAAVLLLLKNGVAAPGEENGATPAWDLPFRMLTATLFVLALTAASGILGPELSGLISPFPIFGVVMASFNHRLQGPAAAEKLLRGVVVGAFAFASFFVMVALLLPALPLAPVYLGATLAALLVNGAALRFAR